MQPGPQDGKDAILHGLSSKANVNFENEPQLASMAWTFDAEPGVIRSVIAFDLSTLPANSVVTGAYLSLYANNFPNDLCLHSSLSGSNEAVLRRVTSYWDESTVTWNNQPSTTSNNEVFLEGTNNPAENFVNIDVTDLVNDMLNDPSNNFGFMLSLVNESYFRRMTFCSSDNSDEQLRPKLKPIYDDVTQRDTCIVIRPNA